MAPTRRKAHGKSTTDMARLAAPEALYTPLPAYVQREADAVLGPQPERSGFVRSFVRDATGSDDAFAQRVHHKNLPLANPPVKSKPKKAPATDAISSRKARARSLFKIPKEQQKYNLYRGLHHLWQEYIKVVMGSDRHPNTLLPRLLKTDLHGSILTVVQSTCPSYVGVSGIVVREATSMMFLITSKDRLIGIPKAHSVFSLAVGDMVLKLHGSQICCRAGERTAKKFKGQNSTEL